MDLLLFPGGTHGPWAIEVKRSLSPAPGKGLHSARQDLSPERTFVVYPGSDRYPLAPGIEAIGLAGMMQELAGLGDNRPACCYSAT